MSESLWDVKTSPLFMQVISDLAWAIEWYKKHYNNPAMEEADLGWYVIAQRLDGIIRGWEEEKHESKNAQHREP